MAGKKKKTKPVANPARGFATTSIASKPKPEKAIVDTSTELSEAPSPATGPTSVASEEIGQPVASAKKSESSRELHELSPEELEAQLEHSELQNVVEQQGPKVRKESTRQASRLQTDRRLLRSQAEMLGVRDWLPDELMQQIVDLALEEAGSDALSNSTPNLLKRSSEDDLLSKVWQLKLMLDALDLTQEQVQTALHHVLAHPPTDESANLVWGLSEIFDWLALHNENGDMLDYDAVKPKSQSLNATANSDAFVPESDLSREDGELRKTPLEDKPSKGPTRSPEEAPIPVVDDIEVSDIESDMDPDEMLSTYLQAKARLFDRNPDLVDTASQNNKKSKSSRGKAPSNNRKPTPGEAKLQQHLKNIESDVLFDQHAADAKWAEHKIDVLQDRAERRKLQVLDDHKLASKPDDKSTKQSTKGNASDDIMAEAEAAASQLLQEVDDDDIAGLGGMFGEAIDTDNAPQQADQLPSANSADLVVRNFGKLSGMSPRRIFEDACRSRDPGAKVQYKMVSATTYNSRHCVTVFWSKDQELVDASFMPDVMQGPSNERRTTLTMTKIATPETAQSEGYISTAALFLLFSTSPKEEKAALRLPPTFRDLWQEFFELKREQRDAIDRETVKTLRDLIREQTEKESDEDIILTAGFRNRNKGVSGVSTPVDGPKVESSARNDELQSLKDMWARKTSTPNYQHMLVARSNLPMFQFRDIALSAVEQNQVTILCGETGCGKSTQMPAFILEHELSRGRQCKIYCTEPRRISAISLAQRVSEEMGEGKGAIGTPRSVVGYSIRLESTISAQTRLIYATVGIVLRMLESAKGFDEVTHLIIDEIHERSIDTDFLLIVLRSLMTRRPDLKVVLMSATVDAQRFSRYLDNAPIVTVPGRTFPVEAKFLEDAIELTGHTIEDGSHTRRDDEDDDDIEPQSDKSTGAGQQLIGYSPKTLKTLANFDEYRMDYGLIIKLLEKIAYSPLYARFSQAILIFLPGIAEIRQLNDALVGHPSFPTREWLVYPLHSTFSSEEQQAAFDIPPQGMRKIVLATNIAETGITIPDVTCVIDTGKHKEMRFDERRQLSRLIQSFISRANAKQRRGRAGRVQEGVCFHLFTKHRHDEIMAEQQTPEMLRLSLQDLVMRVKICKLGEIEHALSQALDPPSLKNIRRAIDALIDADALTQSEELTPLGQQLAKLPLDAQLGKLIILASIFNCLDFALTTAAILSSKSPFLSPMGAKKQADSVRLGFKRGNSDLLTAYNAYSAWRKVCTTPGGSEFQFCRKNFLSPQNLANIEDLKSQLLSSLADAGFVSLSSAEKATLGRVRHSGRHRTFVAVPASSNSGDANDILLNSVTAWSFYPKVLARDGKGWRNIANNQSISLHPNSVNKGVNLDAKFLSFYSIMQSASRFTNAQETSPVDSLPMVLLAGDAVFNMYAGVIIIDGNRLRFKVKDWKTMIVLKTLRSRVKDVLAKTMKSPGRQLGDRQRAWMEMFLGLFDRAEQKGKDRVIAASWN